MLLLQYMQKTIPSKRVSIKYNKKFLNFQTHLVRHHVSLIENEKW